MNENLLQTVAENLQQTNSPIVLLASLYRELFDRPLQKQEWGILGKYVKMYGRWIVYEAMIRTAGVTITTDSALPYIGKVALALLNEENKRRSERKLKDQEMQNTIELIQALRLIKTDEVILATEEDLKRGTNS